MEAIKQPSVIKAVSVESTLPAVVRLITVEEALKRNLIGKVLPTFKGSHWNSTMQKDSDGNIFENISPREKD